MLKSLVNKEYTVVFYESVHRIEKTLDEFESYYGADTQIVIGREITKKFEEFQRGTIAEIRNYFKTEGKVKGEFVVVF
jgi:16S rRNA (cytidine1402-2'-O)-methyltransferase